MYCKLECNNLHKYFNEISLLNFNEKIIVNNEKIIVNNQNNNLLNTKNFIDLYIEYIKLINYPLIKLFKIEKATNIIIKNIDLNFINIFNNKIKNNNICIFNIIKTNLFNTNYQMNYYEILKKLTIDNKIFKLNNYINFLNNIIELVCYKKFSKNIYFILLFFFQFKKLNNLIKNKININFLNKSYKNYYSLKIYKIAEKYLK